MGKMINIKGFGVKTISGSYSKVDSRKIFKGLGASSVMGPEKVDKKKREYFKLEVWTEDGHKKRRIYRLSDKQASKCKLLCETEGQFLFHCLFLGRHTKNFHNRVYGYQVLKPTRKGMKIRVVFYEKIKSA